VECVCGYERLEDYESESGVAVGDEKFINVKGNFTIEDEYTYNIREVNLYSCPKCGTIQMNKW
jgi:hypothetical protein